MKTKEKRTTTSFIKRVQDEEEEQEQIDFIAIQKDLFIELNNLRKDPKSYIPLIEEEMKSLKKNDVLKRKDSNLQIQTMEGKEAYLDAIKFLEYQQPVPPLKEESRLSSAAMDLVNDIGKRGIVSHQDQYGQYVSERIEKYCEWDYSAGEVIEVSSRNPQDILISLIVDDGLKNRPDRISLFNQNYNFVGIGCGEHSEYEIVTVIVFTGSIRQKGTLFYQMGSNFELRNQYEEYEGDYENPYLINDPDAPDQTKGLRIVKCKKNLGNNKIIVTKKFYKLDNGTEYVVELEEF